MKTHNTLITLSMVFLMLFCMAFVCNNGNENGGTTQDTTDTGTTTAPTQEAAQTGIGKPYGSRDPRTCKDKTQPKTGAPSAAQAAQYVICSLEHETGGGNLVLLEDVKVTAIGKGRPYDPHSSYSPSIDPEYPEYAIRGSMKRYFCSKSDPATTGKNCWLYNETKATGSCYKDTFGEWFCGMRDDSVNSRDYEEVAPPQ